MEHLSFHAESMPFDQMDKLAIKGGYSKFYTSIKPPIPIVGDWQKRFCTLADTFKPVLDSVFNFEVHEYDTFIVTSTKCGTTWAQEMVWLVLNNFDFQTAKNIDLTLRSPFLE